MYMNENKKYKTYTLYVSFVPVLILGLIFLALGAYSSTQVVMNALSGKSVLSSQSENSNSDKNANSVRSNIRSNKPLLTDYQPKANSKKYRENITKVATELQKIAYKEEEAGNTEAGQEIQNIAITEEGISGNVTKAINEIESRSAWKNLLSPDYKNLGQLRSVLSHNTNSIRKLTTAVETDTLLTSGTEVNAQLDVLLQERERIINVIKDNESRFSLLGWINKLLTGYDSTPIGPIYAGGGLNSGTGL
jgi:hypothetical protein